MPTRAHAIRGQRVPALDGFDAVIQRCLAEHGVPGAALAVAKDGGIVYSRGFGWADLQSLEPVAPGSRFRLASVSKPITGGALLGLAQGGPLALRDPALRRLPVTAPPAPGTP